MRQTVTCVLLPYPLTVWSTSIAFLSVQDKPDLQVRQRASLHNGMLTLGLTLMPAWHVTGASHLHPAKATDFLLLAHHAPPAAARHAAPHNSPPPVPPDESKACPQAPLVAGLVQAGQHVLAAEYCATYGLDPAAHSVLPGNIAAQLATEAHTFLQLPLPAQAMVRHVCITASACSASGCRPRSACARSPAQGVARVLECLLLQGAALPACRSAYCACALHVWLELTHLHAVQVVVDSVQGCRQAAQHLAGAGCLGIDAEWEPSMKVAIKPQPSIMQVSCPCSRLSSCMPGSCSMRLIYLCSQTCSACKQYQCCLCYAGGHPGPRLHLRPACLVRGRSIGPPASSAACSRQPSRASACPSHSPCHRRWSRRAAASCSISSSRGSSCRASTHCGACARSSYPRRSRGRCSGGAPVRGPGSAGRVPRPLYAQPGRA